jgi:hypothetical protein
VIWIAVALASIVVAGTAILHGGMRWGSTAVERARPMPGDEFLTPGNGRRVIMTRAISIDAAPERVWPWIAQLGRGAGWYSIDSLDNGRRESARHIVHWIPEPHPGDATAIGYLRAIDAGRSLVWWAAGVRFAGATARLATCFAVEADGRGSRVVARMSADAVGATASFALLLFGLLDSIMARAQLRGLRDRVEGEPTGFDTGARDQHQLYEVIYADGDRAGVAGKESAARWRQLARGP